MTTKLELRSQIATLQMERDNLASELLKLRDAKFSVEKAEAITSAGDMMRKLVADEKLASLFVHREPSSSLSMRFKFTFELVYFYAEKTWEVVNKCVDWRE